MSRTSLLAVLFAAAAANAWAQCEAPAAILRLLDRPEFGRRAAEPQAARDARAAAYRDALAQYPDNYFILRRELQMSYFDRPAGERIQRAREVHARHPGDPAFELLEAFALENHDTPQAIRRLEALQAAHPDAARVDLELAFLYGTGRYRDKARAQKELAAYVKLCPDSADTTFLGQVAANGSAEQMAAAAAGLRKSLDARAADPQPDHWEALWRLEFKVHPPAEHDAVRKRVAADLARFEQSPRRHELEWQVFLRNGYESMGDQASVNRLSDEILEEHPQSDEAKRTVQDRWSKEHDEKDTRAHLAAVRDWHKRWPDDAWMLYLIVDDLSGLPDTTAEQMTAAVDDFQAAYRKDGGFTFLPPTEFFIARNYLKYNVRVDQVPALVAAGIEDAARRLQRILDDDREVESTVAVFHDSLDSIRIRAAGLMLDYAIDTKQPAKVKEAMAYVAAVEVSKPFAKAGMAALRAKTAEAEGRKLDALLLYSAALDARINPPRPGETDDLAEGVARMWKDLGGTDDAYALLGQKSKPAEANESRWERPANPLPAFTLSDMQGKTWKLASLEGKTLLVNIWATWCGPCKAEHPEFQKLYDKLKNRPEVTVLSFNVDDDQGKIAPYIAEHHYTFPVIPALDVVQAVVPGLSIPRNWLVDSKGKLEWEQIGYGGEADWQAGMLAKLEEVIRR